MKTVITTLALVSLTLGLTVTQVACSKADQTSTAANPALSAPVPAGMVRGKVVETMDAAGYTYVQIENGGNRRWLAAPKSTVQIGDIVQALEGMTMSNFESKTLNRTFDVVYFVPGLDNLSNPSANASAASPAPADSAGAAGMTPGHPPVTKAPVKEIGDLKVAPVEPGKDIAELYANKDAYAGKQVSLRGKVVKYNANVMGSNFIHIRDGSGKADDGSNDLTVTSKDPAALGDTVVVTGKVTLAKDFGAGYTYPVLVEDAKVTVE